MKALKKICAIALVVMMGVVFTPIMPGVNGKVKAVSEGWEEIGTCEYQLTGEENDKTLTIRPEDGVSGTLPGGYDRSDSWPWHDERGNIKKVVINNGVIAGDSTAKMFKNCEALSEIDVSGLDTQGVINMNAMFEDCEALTKLDVSGFDTHGVTDMSEMFENCKALTELDVSGFDTQNVEDMSEMFDGCEALTELDVSGFDTHGVTDMNEMFIGCSELTTLDLSKFDTQLVTDMSEMFNLCSKLTTIYASDKFVISALYDPDCTSFYDCTSLVGGAGTPFNNNHEKATYARIDGGTADPGYFSYKVSFDTQGYGTAPGIQAVGKNGKVTKPANDPIREGYNFGGWHKDKACTTVWNFDKDTVTDTTILYAKWTKIPDSVPTASKFIAQGTAYKKSINYSWTPVAGATTYKVYQAKCGKKYKKVKTTSATSFTKKKLQRKKNYKAYVVAFNESGQAIAQTPAIHVMTKKGKKSNATAVGAIANATIKVGAAANVGAAITAKDSKKKLNWKNHVSAPIRYYSADPAIATVDGAGNVAGISAGAAYIYSVAPSGVYAVTVITVQ